MTDFTLSSDSVNVEQIMKEIRARIDEKRGVDYTEDEIRRLATVKLETFLDPDKIRSDLVEHFRQGSDFKHEQDDLTHNHGFDEKILYKSSRGVMGPVIYRIRKLLNPILKMFFNPEPLVQKLQRQNETNELTFELLNNLVVEITRLGIDMKNHKMRLESISSRLDFDERRARAMEGLLQYMPERSTGPSSPTTGNATTEDSEEKSEDGNAIRRRRRRRRGRRRTSDGTGEDSTKNATSSEDPQVAEPEAAAPESDKKGDADTPDL